MIHSKYAFQTSKPCFEVYEIYIYIICTPPPCSDAEDGKYFTASFNETELYVVTGPKMKMKMQAMNMHAGFNLLLICVLIVRSTPF